MFTKWMIVIILALIFILSQIYFEKVVKKSENFGRGFIIYLTMLSVVLITSLVTLVNS